MDTIFEQAVKGDYAIDIPKNFDINQIFDCGQCFRFNRSESCDNTYNGIAFSKKLTITQKDGKVIFHNTSKEEFEKVWHTFFDLDTNYADVIGSFSDDRVLAEASAFSSGIRILRQDSWEALCSFIISQNNNIPRIKGIIEHMSEKYGKPIESESGIDGYSFPTPKALCDAGESGLFALKTGFRAKYIYDAASKVESGEINLSEIDKMKLEDALPALEAIKGVGPKVAACTLLFGFAKHDAFPIDVWVKRILSSYYSDGASHHFSEKNAGIAQQYLFYYERCKNNIFI